VYRVAAGLDSMVVGEAPILRQLRDAYAVVVEHDAVGRETSAATVRLICAAQPAQW
jgi:glutamyl-tRNA reductase